MFFSLGFSTGPQTIYVIQNASLLGSSSTGVALSHNLNPANIELYDTYVSFSKNNSIHDLEGQKISFLNILNNKKSFFSFENLSSSSIAIYGDSPPPDDEPIGFFDVYWYAVEFSQSMKFKYFEKNDIRFGYKFQANLYKLFTSKSTDYSFSFGLSKKINNQLNVGLVVNNLGAESSGAIGDQISGTYDGNIAYGIGLNYNMVSAPINISSDVYYRNNKIINKFSIKTDFPYLNLVFGKTIYSGYNDFTYGININFKGWKFIYGYLSYKDNSIGNPRSIQITRQF